MVFSLELENYQGPFDVLLELLNRRQLDITELSLAEITNEYLAYIADLELSLDEMNWFLFVATKLAFDKSQAILSIDSINEDANLAESLQQYAIIKELANQLTIASKAPHYVRPYYKFYGPTEVCSLDDLTNIYNLVQRQFNSLPKSRTISSRSEQLKRVRSQFITHIRKLKSFSNQEVINNATNRTEAALYLLTLLDLLRSGALKIGISNPEILEAV